jgi:hypothetical protein
MQLQFHGGKVREALLYYIWNRLLWRGISFKHNGKDIEPLEAKAVLNEIVTGWFIG